MVKNQHKCFMIFHHGIDSIFMDTVEHINDACPKFGELGSFRIIMYLYVKATVAAADSASTVRKKYSVFIYSEAEPHTM